MKSKLVLFSLVSLMTFSLVQAKSSVQTFQTNIFYEIAHGNKKAIKTWLKSRPDLSIRNQEGQSVLAYAVLTGQRDVVKMLVKAGAVAVINAVDNAGKTALDHAVEMGHEKIVFDLVKKRAHVSNYTNLQQVKALVNAYTKKIMRRFLIMLPIMSVLFIPAFICGMLALLPAMTWYQTFSEILFLLGYPPAAIYMLTLPMQASAWTIRSNRVKILS